MVRLKASNLALGHSILKLPIIHAVTKSGLLMNYTPHDLPQCNQTIDLLSLTADDSCMRMLARLTDQGYCSFHSAIAENASLTPEGKGTLGPTHSKK